MSCATYFRSTLTILCGFLDIIVIAIIVPLLIASGVLLVTDPHGEPRLLVDYFIDVGFLTVADIHTRWKLPKTQLHIGEAPMS